MRPRDWRSSASRIIEATLVVIGVVSLAGYGWLTHELRRLESENRDAVARMLRERVIATPTATAAPSRLAVATPDPGLIGELDIPRLHVSAAVRAGDDDDVLAGAVGYLPDTPLPWERGNSTFAAHRDRIFRPLAGIRIGDEILLSTRHGDLRYVVSRTLVVGPRDVWVLDSADDVDLTLITCYPFVYVGHAPQRFVVRAKKIDVP